MPANRSRPAPIAQLDRALPSEGRGQRFESSWVRQISSKTLILLIEIQLLWIILHIYPHILPTMMLIIHI